MMARPDDKRWEALYQKGIGALIDRVKSIHESEAEGRWSPTPMRNELLGIAERLQSMADVLGQGTATQFELERVHNERGTPEPTIGVDGYPAPRDPDDRHFESYDGVRLEMIELAASAREAAKQLPDARERQALPFAALGLLHLRCDYRFSRPVLSNDSDDVCELERICHAAGIALSRERLRGALAEALKRFDPHFLPPEYKLLFSPSHSSG